MNPGDVVIERYRLERELGRGGMGAVWLARDLREGREVALKVSAALGAAHDEFKARFEREARIGCALGQERGFVRAFDWGELPDGRTLYMVMDLVREARPLDLREGTLGARLERVERAAALVARAHALGVVHRDLKPANLLVDAAGEVWLADFGLAKLAGDSGVIEGASALLTRTGTGMGTPHFMPPEQFEDAKQADERADVFALGVMLFYAATGRYPFDGTTPHEVYARQKKVQYGEAPAPRPRQVDPGLSLGLDALCAEALALDPRARVQSVKLFLAGLGKVRARQHAGRASGRAAGVDASLATFEGGPPTASATAATRLEPPPSGVEGSLASVPPTAPDPRPLLAPRGEGRGAFEHMLEEVFQRSTLRVVLPALAIMLLFGGIRLIAGTSASRAAAARRGAEHAERLALDAERGPPRGRERSELGEDASPEARDLERRAWAGDAEAMVALGGLLERGEGVRRDAAAALRLYQRAAGDGHTGAMVCAGELLLDGAPGVVEDARQARSWFERAARLGDSQAAMHLSSLDMEKAQADEARRAERAREAEERRRELERRAEERRRELEARRARR